MKSCRKEISAWATAILAVLLAPAALEGKTASTVALKITGPSCSGTCTTSNLGQIITLQTSGTMGGGKITFFVDDTILGVAFSSGSASITSSLTTNQLPVGVHNYKATYGGDTLYAGSTSPLVSHTVVSLPQNGFKSPPYDPATGNLTTIPTGCPSGRAPVRAVTADFRRTGVTDVAILCDNNNGTSPVTVAVLLNNGDGTFQDPASYIAMPAGTKGTDLAVADLNLDGYPDLVVAGADQDTFLLGKGPSGFSVFLGTANGTFDLEAKYGVIGGTATSGTSACPIGAWVNITLWEAKKFFTKFFTWPTPITYCVESPLTVTVTPPSVVSVAVGDFDGDGIPDLVFADAGTLDVADGLSAAYHQSYVTVWFGNGTGGFGSRVDVPIGTKNKVYNPSAVAVGDFNRDGKTDIVVALAGGNFINCSDPSAGGTCGFATIFSNGDRTFQSPAITTFYSNWAVGGKPGQMKVVNLNADGYPDVVSMLTGDGGSASVVSLYNRADNSGLFNDVTGATVSSGDGTEPFGLGQFNNDGRLGLIVGQKGQGGGPANVLTRPGSIVGGFAGPTYYSTENAGEGVLAADFNGDGRTDFLALGTDGNLLFLGSPVAPDVTATITSASLNWEQGFTGSFTIAIANIGDLSTSDDQFNVRVTLPAGLTATAASGTGWGCVLQNSGSAVVCGRAMTLAARTTFGTPIVISVNIAANAPIGVGATIVKLTGINGAAALGGELNLANNQVTANVTILQAYSFTLSSTPNPSNLSQSVTVTVTSNPNTASGKGKFYDGGVLIGSAQMQNGSATLTTSQLAAGAHALYFRYDLDGKFSPALTQTVGSRWQNGFTTLNSASYSIGGLKNIAAGDLNHDGKTDLVVATTSGVSILKGIGDGKFTVGASYSTGTTTGVAIGDFNNDGIPDLVACGGGAVAFLPGNGDGTFGTRVDTAAGSGQASVAVGDFNRDGNLDLVVLGNQVIGGTNFGAAVFVLLGKGDGTFQSPSVTLLATGFFGPLLVTVADMNGDGLADIVAASDLLVSVLRGRGDGTFTNSVAFSSIASITSLAVSDLNGDGYPDIAYAGNNFVRVGLSSGSSATFGQPTNYTISGNYPSLAVGDFNGDGSLDLIYETTATAPANFGVLYGNGNGTFQSPALNSFGGDDSTVPMKMAVGDFNRDGVSDLAMFSFGTVQIVLGVVGNSDLTVSSTHTGSFYQGQAGAAYTLTVKNTGNHATGGNVLVIDTLPSGLTAIAISGTGWSCILASVQCSRLDALAAGASYPPIAVTVNVAMSAAAAVTNSVLVGGGGETDSSNDTGTDATTIQPVAPITVTAGNFSFSVDNVSYTSSQTLNWIVGSPHTIATTYPQTSGGASYGFLNWSDGGAMSHSVTAPAAATTYTATFAPMVSITVTTSPSGRTFTVDGTSYSASQTLSWVQGSSHTIGVATPQSGASGVQYVYNNWSDSGAASHSITVPASAATYTANFTTQYQLTTAASAGGTVSPASGLYYNSGTVVSLAGTANSGYQFVNWTGSTVAASGSASTTVTMSGPASVTASFQQMVSVAVGTSSSGLLFTVDNVNYSANRTFSWPVSSTHTITITATQVATGQRQINGAWSDGGALSHSITAVAGASFTANYDIESQLTLTATDTFGGGGSGTFNVASGTWYRWGTVVNVTVTPASDSNFTGWAGSYGSSPAISVTMNGPVDLIAIVQRPVTTLVNTSPDGRTFTVNNVSLSSRQTSAKSAGQGILVSTTSPQSGGSGTQYVFTGWSDSGAMSHSGRVPVDAVTNSTYTLTASFKTQHQLTMTTSTGGSISPAPGSAYYDSGTPVPLTATPSSGFIFVGWTDAATGQPSPAVANPAGASTSVTLSGALSLKAFFVKSVSVTLTSSPVGRKITVDSKPYTTPQTFTWGVSSIHAVAAGTDPGTAGTQYTFGTWSDSGAPSHSITAPPIAATYTANFNTQYQLTTATSPTAGGSITPASGTWHNSGTVVSLGATTAVGYQFQNWTGSVAGSGNATTTVTMSGPQTVTANFQTTASVTVGTSPAGLSFTVDNVTYTSSQTFTWSTDTSHSIGTTSTQAGNGTQYVLSTWSDNGAPSHNVTAAGSSTYTANFTTKYQLTTAAGAGGSVSPASGSYYQAGTVVNLTATANSGNQFNSWSGPAANTASAATTVTMSAPMSVTANFAPTSGVLVNTVPAGLTFTVDGIPYSTPQSFSWVQSTQHTIAASGPQAGGAGVQYVFANWSDSPNSPSPSHTVTAGASGAVYTANFTTRYQLTTAAGTGGSVSPASGNYYDAGTPVNVSATPNSGYQFQGWTGPVVNNAVTMNAPASVTASFAQVAAVTVGVSPSGPSFTVDGVTYTSPQTFTWVVGNSHSFSTSATQSGAAGTQYIWNHWSDTGLITHNISVPSTPATYTAYFDTQYLLTAGASPAAGGGVSPASGYYYAGTSVPVSATPNAGFAFSGWTGPVSSSSVTMNGPVTITANFGTIGSYTVATSPAGLSFSVDGTAYTSAQTFSWVAGSTHTISTSGPQSGGTGTQYVLAPGEIGDRRAGWSDSGAASHTITAPDSGAAYTANFTTQYQLTTAATPAAGGTVTPASGGFYNAGASVPVGATANSGYQFGNWTGPVSGGTVSMTGPISIAANFQQFTSVTVAASPSGLTFAVDGVAYTASKTFNWVVGSSHSIAANNQAGSPGSLYAFTSWPDNGAASHDVTVPASPSIMTAVFTLQYQLTTSAGAGGSVTPASGSYFNSSSTATVAATPNPGFKFAGWTGPVANASSAETTVTMSGPVSISASFQALIPDLTISQTHSGSFTQGQGGASYSVVVRNIGNGPSSGPVVAAESLPAGLSLASISGSGWTCTAGTLSCSRSDALAAGASYPAITVSVNVAPNAPASVTSSATVSGGGEVNAANNASSDPTTIASGAPVVIDVSSQVKWTGSGLSFNRGTGLYTGTVTITIIGTTPIAAPIQAVFVTFSSGLSLMNANGSVSSGAYAGAPFITAPGTAALAPGGSVTIAVQFKLTGTSAISYAVKVISGVL